MLVMGLRAIIRQSKTPARLRRRESDQRTGGADMKIVTYKTCFACKIRKPIKNFPPDRVRKDGLHPYCHECHSARRKLYYARNKKQAIENRNKWAERNPEKIRAHWKIRDAVKRGIIEKPKACTSCGKAGRVEAHHWRGYDEKSIFDVLWLCPKCHNAEELKIKRGR